MATTRHESMTCAYPGCENEPQSTEEGMAAQPKYCGLPDPVSAVPHTALTAFQRREELARQGGGVAEPEPGRPGIALWRYRRADAQRRQRAEALAEEARAAVREADERLTEALAAKAAAEQEAVAVREAAEARVAEAQRAAGDRVAAAQQERDHSVSAANLRADEAESRARTAEQDAAGAREAAELARAELERAREAADRQVSQVRDDAAREQAGLRAAFEAQAAAAESARAELQARAEHAEAELQRVRGDRNQTPGQATPGRPGGATRGRRRYRG
jgi:hypothetical protein